ncbi:PerC family transcriptional regulator [Klebsiella aerogenes]
MYRRATARWPDIMILCTEDDDREWLRKRRDSCLMNTKRPIENR